MEIINKDLTKIKHKPFRQLYFLAADYKRQSGSVKLRMIYLWLGRAPVGVFLYRFERMMFLLFGKSYKLIRIPLVPVLFPLYAYSNCEISYHAEIGPGITVLHPSMGVVISGFAKIGKNLTLTGGNVIGTKPLMRRGGAAYDR